MLFDIGYADRLLPALTVPERPLPNAVAPDRIDFKSRLAANARDKTREETRWLTR